MKISLLFLMAVLSASAVLGAEEQIIESITVGAKTYHQVRVVETTPLELLFAYDGGYQRLKLQELPEPLKSKYPYDQAKAAAYQKKKAAEPQELAAQGRTNTRAALGAREKSLQNRIEPLEKELKRIEDQIKTQHNIAKGRGKKSKEKKETDELRDKKIDLQKQIWKLKDEMQLIKEQRERLE